MLSQKKLYTKTLVALANVLANVTKKGIIYSGDDMNNYTGTDKTGFYEIRNNVGHTPQDWTWCIVIGGSGTLQLAFSQNKIFIRAYTGTPLTWTAWRSITLT